MMDEFIAFLAGEPHKMDEDWQQTWAYFVGCKMPYILRDWHDSAFREGDVWKKDGAYYESLRQNLAAMPAFKKKLDLSCCRKGKRLFDRLCKRFMPIYPDAVRFYIDSDKEMYGGENDA